MRLPVLCLLASAVPALAADPPAAPKQTPVDPTAVPPALADWTPRPAVGKAEPWEKATDKDWVDGRFRLTDTGPFLNCTFRYPHEKGQLTAYKATVVRLPGGGAAFDRNTLRWVAGWAGGYLQHSDRRFGLLNTPTPVGAMAFSHRPAPVWDGESGTPPPAPPARYTAPAPERHGRYRGLYLTAGGPVVLFTVGGWPVYQRVVAGPDGRPVIETDVPNRELAIPAPARQAELAALTAEPAGRRWGESIVTKLVRGSDGGPFAVDTLTIPYENRYKALFFCTGLDLLPDGRLAVCTCHGDVWLVTVDEAKAECRWQRYATGLYHPLGLKVIDGKVVVLERGQLTRLHDRNADGEADHYECLNADWHCGGGEHSYDTCLETDPAGNFYFFKTGDTDTPTGGCLMKVTKDGSKAEVFATGFRHPIGLGASPSGLITGADQEGNWMPATRIDQYRPGGFYGDMRAHHRTEPPKTYDGPLCWLPREVDNSAGGQVWVPAGSKWPLAGLPLHLSYGRCKPFVLLRQELPDGRVQGGVADLGLKFLSGVCRGRFGPDGHLYVCGLNGWQTAAQADGCVQRVRHTGQPLDVPVKLEAVSDGVRLTFSRPLDRAKSSDPANYRAAWWGYRWSGEYGSKRWRVSDPTKEGQDDVPVSAAEVSADGRTVLVRVPGMRPVMQMQVGYNVAAADGGRVVGSVFLTAHGLGR